MRRVSRREAHRIRKGINRRFERNGESATQIHRIASPGDCAGMRLIGDSPCEIRPVALLAWRLRDQYPGLMHSHLPFHFLETNMKQYFNVIRAVALTVALTFVAGACNTIQGAGKDIERGGQKIERAADKAKD
jgi:predicted small secreted protein